MIEWIASSSALILLVLAVRALAKTRLGCRARYALWLLVLMRLLVPAQLFTASWGVAEVDMPEVVVTHRDAAGLQLAPEEPDPSLPREEQEVQWRKNWTEYEAELRRARIEHGTPVTLAEILRAVWLVGAGVLVAVLLVSNLRFARRLRRTRIPYDALVGGMRVYVAEGLASPCLVGVFRPAVYLTSECTRDERTLRHVLAHETTHRLHGDCVWSALRLIALCLHWYNPLVWYAVVVSKRDGELACDEATLARLGEDERYAYGETLLSMVTAKPRRRDLLSASTAMTVSKKPMRERIETIARHPRTKLAALLLALAVLLSATVFAFSKSAEPEAAESNDTEPTEQSPVEVIPAVPVAAAEQEPDQPAAEHTAGRYEGNGWSVDVPTDRWTLGWADNWYSLTDANAYFRVDWSPNSVFNVKASWAETGAWPYQTDMPAPFDGYYSLTHWTHESGGAHEEMYFVEGPENSSYTLWCAWDSDHWDDALIAELHAMLQSFTVDERLNKDDQHPIASLLRSSSFDAPMSYRVFAGEAEQPAVRNEVMMHELRMASYSVSALELPTDEVLPRYVTITYGEGAAARKLYVYASTQPPYLLLRLEDGNFIQEYNRVLYTLLTAYQAGGWTILYDLDRDGSPEALCWPDGEGSGRMLLYRYLADLGPGASVEALDVCAMLGGDAVTYGGEMADYPAELKGSLRVETEGEPARYYRYERGQFTQFWPEIDEGETQ